MVDDYAQSFYRVSLLHWLTVDTDLRPNFIKVDSQYCVCTLYLPGVGIGMLQNRNGALSQNNAWDWSSIVLGQSTPIDDANFRGDSHSVQGGARATAAPQE